jgi:DNA-binding XRE family transcriptional regulator
MSLQNAPKSSYTQNCERCTPRSVRLIREVARKTAARITRRALELRDAVDRRLLVNISTVKRSPHATDRHVGNRVRMRRRMQGMTQEKLGNALGLSFQQVQKYEKGTNPDRGQPPATYRFNSASPNLFLLRRCTRTIVHPGRALRRCLRLPRHVGRACAHESLHAHRKCQAQAIHCCFG